MVDFTIPTSGVGTYPGVAQTVRRSDTVTTKSRTTGSMYGTAIYLEAGAVVRAITFVSGGASSTVTLRKFAIYDAAFQLVASTSNDAVGWSASQVKTLDLSASYTVPTGGVYYAAVLEVAGTTASLVANSLLNIAANGLTPFLAWTQAGLADLPSTATPSTSGSQQQFYAVASGTAAP